MIIVAATRVLDEADIIEAFVRHTAAFVDHHLLLDNGSRDGTLAILGALRADGAALTVLSTPSVAFSEEVANSLLLAEAARTHGARWVIFLDADEFIDDRRTDRGLRALLSHAHDHRPLISQFKVALTDYVATPFDEAADPVVPTRLVWREEPSRNFKTIVNTRVLEAGAHVQAGGHGASWSGGGEVWPFAIEPGLTHAHYPERSAWQWISKFVRGWAKVLAAGQTEVARGRSAHYADPFALLRDDPGRILDDPRLMNFKNDRPGLTHDPIRYRGGPLVHTPPVDHRLHAIGSVMSYVELLATRHGALLEASPEARRLTAEWDLIAGSEAGPTPS